MKPTRRDVLTAGAAVLFGGGALAAGRAFRPLDFRNPQDNLHALVKLRGDLAGKRVLLWYQGTGLAALPGRVPAPLYRVQGLIRSSWTPQTDGSFAFESYDLGFYGDLQTGAPLRTFENPFNGARAEPIHVHDGPAGSLYSVHGSSPPGRPIDTSQTLALPWQRAGDDVWFEQSFGFEFSNPLQPDAWPRASTGETIRFRFHNTFRGRLTELEDFTRTSAPLTAVYLGIGPWPPWLLMGQTPGHHVLQYQARKLTSEAEIPPAMQDYIERTEPTYLSADRPWAQSLNAWERYQAKHS